MRVASLLVLAGCGGATVTSTTVEPAESGAPPADIADHHHEAPQHEADAAHLYVEITSDGEHAETLRRAASDGVGTVAYARAVQDGGDVELHVELSALAPARDATTCKVKVFVLRLPQHDLLAIADGSARATGAAPIDTCVSTVATAVVRDKLPALFERQRAAKR